MKGWAAHLLFEGGFTASSPHINTLSTERSQEALSGASNTFNKDLLGQQPWGGSTAPHETHLEHFGGQTLPSKPSPPLSAYCPWGRAAYSHELEDICLQEGLVGGQHFT